VKKLGTTLLFCFSLLVSGQGLEGNFILSGFGGQFERYNDQFLSPNRYSGFSGSAVIGWHHLNEKWIDKLDFRGEGGWQNIEGISAANQTLSLVGRLHYSLAYQIYRRNGNRLFAGLQSANYFNFREHNQFQNSANVNTGFFSYGPSLSYIFSAPATWPSILPRFAWQSSAFIGLGSLLMRPAFTRAYREGLPAIIEHRFIGALQHWEFRHNLIYRLKNGNQIRLAYQWNYQASESPLSQALGSHTLELQLFFKL